MRLPLWLGLAVCLVLAACSGASTKPDAGLFFPTKPGREAMWMQALFQGPLAVRDRCVFVGRAGDYAIPIWRQGFTAEQDDAGRLVVRDEDGLVVAVEGDSFDMGGGYVAEFRPQNRVEPREEQLRRLAEWLGYPIPERCLGPDVYGVWSVGET